MKTVPLHGKKAAGQVALVDDEDYEIVMQYRWCATESAKPGKVSRLYAVSSTPVSPRARRQIYMHTLIMGCLWVDHVNRDSLDNQRSNLRPATARQNLLNQSSRPGARSPYKGVDWKRSDGLWRARIRTAPGVRLDLGLFKSEEDAARAYDAAARQYHGEFAYLNFP